MLRTVLCRSYCPVVHQQQLRGLARIRKKKQQLISQPPPPQKQHQPKQDVLDFADLSAPHLFYPSARRLERRLICHVGPTNSGKTFAALQGVKKADQTVYCAPLRLLAWEVHNRLTEEGYPSNLVTGQEKILLEDAGHTSCTVEMCDLSLMYDVAVLDESQLLGDPSRGWAWTRALLGLQAREIHLCGSETMIPLVQRLAAELDEPLEIIRYDRLSPLKVAKRPVASLAALRAGDCVVAFSRKRLHELKGEIEAATGGSLKCSVVYGGLPPAVRKEQARLFNDPSSGYDCLVASDAVGMGLNLAIKRIVFSGIKKFDGVTTRPLTGAETKQIAGRAGRYAGPLSAKSSGGVVTAFADSSMEHLRSALTQVDEPVATAGLLPSLEQLEIFAQAAGGYDSMKEHSHRSSRSSSSRANVQQQQDALTMSDILEAYARAAQHDESLYHLCDMTDMLVIARAIEKVPLPLAVRYQFLLSPADTSDAVVVNWLRYYATELSYRGVVPLGMRLLELDHHHDAAPTASISSASSSIDASDDDHYEQPRVQQQLRKKSKRRLPPPPQTAGQLLELETQHKILDLYIWLGLRNKREFVDLEKARLGARGCSAEITRGLAAMQPVSYRSNGQRAFCEYGSMRSSQQRSSKGKGGSRKGSRKSRHEGWIY